MPDPGTTAADAFMWGFGAALTLGLLAGFAAWGATALASLWKRGVNAD